MSKVKDTTGKIKSKITAIKKINDDPKIITDKVADQYLTDLPTNQELLGKKVDDFLLKRNSKKENRTDIFGQIVDLATTFTNKSGSPKNTNIGASKSFKEATNSTENKVKQNGLTAASKVLEKSRVIINDNVSKIFFAGDGICGSDRLFPVDSVTLKPKEIDLLNILTINPDNGIGKIIYEDPNLVTPKIKFDRQLYAQFSSVSPYTFNSINGNDLFDLTWDTPNQRYNLTGLSGQTVGNFISDYYGSIVYPDIDHIIKTSMLLTIQGDGSETSLFNLSLDKVERLLQKLMTICGNSTNRNDLKNQNPIDLFDETDEDIEYYFNFNDVEGIDLDAEDARARGVLKFKDCNNFELPKNTTMMEDFIYFIDTENIHKLTDDTLNRVASDAYEQSDSSISLDNFKLSLINLFILNLPKALISSLLTPKIFVPIVTVYKAINNIEIDLETLMKLLSKLFYSIIRDLFWSFLNEFWRLTKPDLVKFLEVLVLNIIKNKNKRYIIIIKALISLLTRILEEGLPNCEDLFGSVLNTINSALSVSSPFNVPGLLLGFADKLPGYSEDRATLNIMERMEAAGIGLGPIYGDSNKLVDLVASVVKGNSEEIDANSYVAVSNKEIIIPSPVGPIIIPPGLLNSAGKTF